MNTGEFDLEAGDLCLDFANTLEWHAGEHPVEKLKEYADLIVWAEAASILSADEADHVRRLASQQPENAAVAYDKALHLRETIYRIFSSLSDEGGVNSDDLAILNLVLSKAMPHLRIVSFEKGFGWDWNDRSSELNQMLWHISRSAAELLVSNNLDRVRECEDDRGCGYLFIDNSRNRSRRWCSMDSCGNRAKARRHYARRRNVQIRED